MKEAQEHILNRLRASEARFRSAFDHAAIGMALVALDGRWLEVNRSVCGIVGYCEAELLARDFQSITHRDDLEADLLHVRRLIAGEIRDYQMVKRYIHKQGHVVWVLLSVSLVRDEGGNPLYFISQIQDITQRKEAEDALRASEELYRTSFELDAVGKAESDLHTGRFIRANVRFCQLMGYSAHELCSKSIFDLTHPEDIERSRALVAQLARGEASSHECEKRYIRKDGQVIWGAVSASLIRDANGRPRRMFATVQDITQRKQSEWLERDRRQVLEMVARDLPLPDVLDSLAQMVQRQVEGMAAIIALQDGALSLHGPNLPGDLREAVMARCLTVAAALARGAWRAPDRCGVTLLRTDALWRDVVKATSSPDAPEACWAALLLASEHTPYAPLGLLTVFCREPRRPSASDVQTIQMAASLAAICIEHHNTTRQLAHLVRHDALTGLPNRIFFEDRVQQALALARRSGKHVAIVVLDMDHFKTVNDTLGHDAGDALLQQFAFRVRRQLRETDTIARMGGDEFTLVLPELKDPQGAITVAQKLLRSLAEPFEVNGRQLAVTSSIGIALYPADGEDSASLQRLADELMYRAKRNGRNGYAVSPTTAAAADSPIAA